MAQNFGVPIVVGSNTNYGCCTPRGSTHVQRWPMRLFDEIGGATLEGAGSKH